MVTRLGTESDADLVAAASTGDARASGELYQRHHAAVLGYARGLVRDHHTAEDLTSEAFTRTLAALRQGLGPQEAYRSYLYTVVRNAAVDLARAGQRTVVTDEVAGWAEGTSEDPMEVDERDALVRAFRSLPERWQTVLWYTIVEDEPIQRVAELLGLEPNAVSQLAFRAREGLRQAFLAASFEGRPECAEYTAELAANLRRPGRRRSRALRRHLATCEECRRVAGEMSDLNQRLRRCLPIGVAVLGAPTAPFAPIPVAGGGLPGWVAPAGGAAVVAIALLVVGGQWPGHEPKPRPTVAVPTAPPSSGPPTSAAPAVTSIGRPTSNSARPSTAGATKKPVTTAGVYHVRNTTLQSCLEPVGTDVMQRSCNDAAAGWKRKNTSGGFALASNVTGKCLARGAESAGVPWEGGTQYGVTTAACGGANQVWKLTQFAPGVMRLVNGGYYLQASWSGLTPVALKPFSFAGMAAQGWAIEH
jgi:RNA polymerase sigma factor (sigma-70 family)